jgi:hypothetical protein
MQIIIFIPVSGGIITVGNIAVKEKGRRAGNHINMVIYNEGTRGFNIKKYKIDSSVRPVYDKIIVMYTVEGDIVNIHQKLPPLVNLSKLYINYLQLYDIA